MSAIKRKSQAAALFEALGWWFPANISLSALDRLGTILCRLPEEKREPALALALADIYDGDYLASMLRQGYATCPFANDYLGEIEESFEAHFLRLDRAAIATLVPVVEGILTKLGQHHGLAVGGRVSSKHLYDVIDGLADRERNRNWELIDERLLMIDSFRSFMSQLYNHTNAFQGYRHLNRHGILHARFVGTDYYSPHNFRRLVSALDLLCFFIRIDLNAGFLLPPDPTEESTILARRWKQLGRRT